MDEDYAAMFNANVDANIMLMKQKKIIIDQDAEIERLREALINLLACPAIADGSHQELEYYCEETVRAESNARSALQQKESE